MAIPPSRVRVLGIDPGLASVGWGVVDLDGARLFYVDHGCVTTRADQDMALRLGTIREALADVFRRFQPDESAMEALYFARNVSSALSVAEARGVIRLVCLDAGQRIAEYQPTEVKRAATGAGGSGKAQVQGFVKLVLGLDAPPRPDHAADALAVAICHCQSRAFASVDQGLRRRV